MKKTAAFIGFEAHASEANPQRAIKLFLLHFCDVVLKSWMAPNGACRAANCLVTRLLWFKSQFNNHTGQAGHATPFIDSLIT